MKLVKAANPLVVKSRVMSVLKSFVREARCNVGKIEVEDTKLGHFYASIETDGRLATDLRDEFLKIPGLQIVEFYEYDGHYDWQADTYIRPASVVVYKVK